MRSNMALKKRDMGSGIGPAATGSGGGGGGGGVGGTAITIISSSMPGTPSTGQGGAGGGGGGGGLGRDVHHYHQEVDAGDAVEEAVVDLGDERAAVAFDAVDEVELPQRLVAAEPALEEERGGRAGRV